MGSGNAATVFALIAAFVIAPRVLAAADVSPMSASATARRTSPTATAVPSAANPSVTPSLTRRSHTASAQRTHSHTCAATPTLTRSLSATRHNTRPLSHAPPTAESNTYVLAWAIGFLWAALVLAVVFAVMVFRRLRATDEANHKRKASARSGHVGSSRHAAELSPPTPGSGPTSPGLRDSDVVPITPEVWFEGITPPVVDINGPQPAASTTYGASGARTHNTCADNTDGSEGASPRSTPTVAQSPRHGLSSTTSPPARRYLVDDDHDGIDEQALPLPAAAITVDHAAPTPPFSAAR